MCARQRISPSLFAPHPLHALLHFRRMNAFIFDMDGVLVDNSDFHVQAWTVYARRFGRELSTDDIKRRLGYNNREYMRFVLGREPTETEVADSTEQKEALYREIFRPHLAAPPGLIDLLNFARRTQIPCGVATSAPDENVRFVLDGLKIRSYFTKIVDAGHVTHCKPDPEIYVLAAQRLAVPAPNCIVFEDAIAGIQSAHAAGMRVIALTTSYPAAVLQDYHPDALIASFEDLASPCPAAALIETLTGMRLTLTSPRG